MIEKILKKFFDILDFFLAHQVPSKLGYGHQIIDKEGLDINSYFVINTVAELKAPIKVFEFACGQGVLAQEIAIKDNVVSYLACDIDGSALKQFEERLKNERFCKEQQETIEHTEHKHHEEPLKEIEEEALEVVEDIETLVDATGYHYQIEDELAEAGDKNCTTVRIQDKIKTHRMSALEPDIDYENYFDVVIADKFLHLLAPEDIEKVFNSARNLLKPGGLFMINSASINNMVFSRTDETSIHPLYRKLKDDMMTRLWYNITIPYVFFVTEEFIKEVSVKTDFEFNENLICPDKDNYLTIGVIKK